MALILSTAVATEPITLTDAKIHLRVDGTDEDTYITRLLSVVRDHAETVSLHALAPQTWKLYLDAWPGDDFIEIPKPPLTSITSITYKDEDGDTNTLSTDVYFADTNRTPGRVVLKPDQVWPDENLYPSGAICITFVCGFAAAANVPPSAIQAMYVRLADMFENRESVVVGQQVNAMPDWFVHALLDLRLKALKW